MFIKPLFKDSAQIRFCLVLGILLMLRQGMPLSVARKLKMTTSFGPTSDTIRNFLDTPSFSLNRVYPSDKFSTQTEWCEVSKDLAFFVFGDTEIHCLNQTISIVETYIENNLSRIKGTISIVQFLYKLLKP